MPLQLPLVINTSSFSSADWFKAGVARQRADPISLGIAPRACTILSKLLLLLLLLHSLSIIDTFIRTPCRAAARVLFHFFYPFSNFLRPRAFGHLQNSCQGLMGSPGPTSILVWVYNVHVLNMAISLGKLQTKIVLFVNKPLLFLVDWILQIKFRDTKTPPCCSLCRHPTRERSHLYWYTKLCVT